MGLLQGYIIKPENLHLSTSGSNPTLPLRMSANPYDEEGMPKGAVVTNGLMHNALPDDLPSLIVYRDNGCEIVDRYDVRKSLQARFIFSGSCMLVRSGKRTNMESSLSIVKTKSIKRMGVGLMENNKLIFLVKKCTAYELQEAFYTLGAYDAMMMAYGDVFLAYPRGGMEMGNTMPVTVLEAMDFEELERPIVVIDPGHGGIDPGAVGFGDREKDFNLKGAKIVHKYFLENFEGTYLMTRIDDSTVELEDRPKMANAIDADYFLSLHCNAFNGKATGYETFVYTTPFKTSENIREVLHKTVMDYLAPHGFVDRGMKSANFCVLRETKMSAILVENLFVDNTKDNKFLNDENLFRGLYLATAEGFAKGVGLPLRSSKTDGRDENTLYKVQVGAFKFRRNAEGLVERLKSDGYDTYIVKEKIK